MMYIIQSLSLYWRYSDEDLACLDHPFLDRAASRDVRGDLSAPAVSQSRRRAGAISDELVTRRSRSWERPGVDVAPLRYVSGSNLAFGLRQAGGLRGALRRHSGAIRRILSPRDRWTTEPGLDRNHGHRVWGSSVGRRCGRSDLWLDHHALNNDCARGVETEAKFSLNAAEQASGFGGFGTGSVGRSL